MDVELIPASIITYIEERIEAIKSTYKITEDSSNNE